MILSPQGPARTRPHFVGLLAAEKSENILYDYVHNEESSGQKLATKG